MKIGAVFPTTEIGNDPSVIRDWTETAEGLGYDYILTYDHVLGAVHAGREPVLQGPYTEDHPFHEPMVLFGYMAGLTKKIEFCTGILILPQRQTALVAKQTAELAVLSEGRLRVGVGTGWNYVEYESLGVPYEGRGKRFDEQIDLLKRLWNEALVDFDGAYHRIDRANILPKPPEPIPLWFGATSQVAMRRAARVGDGLIFGTRPQNHIKMFDKAQEFLEAAGRSPADFGVEASLDFSLGERVWREDLDLWREKGGTHIAFRAMDTANEMLGLETVGYSGPQDYIDALETFMKAIR